MNPALDKRLKCVLQREYEVLFPENEQSVGLAADRIGMSRKKAEKYFSKVPKNPDGTMDRENIIRRLMGGRLYWEEKDDGKNQNGLHLLWRYEQ